MRQAKFSIIAALAACGLAQTPPGFEPAVEANLAVIFEAGAVEEPGTSFTIAETAQLPTIGTAEPLEGTYILLVVDISVPGGAQRQKLLHGLISGYTSAAEPNDAGIYVLETADPASPASYIGPGPPPENPPYAHSYVEVLFVQPDGWEAPAVDFSGFGNRFGIDVGKLIESYGLGEPVAANYFNVTGV
ncbi:uncharacterized protein DNG_07082 [Cephalotrichum gorgonifer]|uniref:PEBP-like protein n=1 Tax=Cephalotrichum gorgonifer TaxID=2041049 RepID=A0AAE8SXW4_9PEZI|nr:uncharacterized protein DNG_07082 [Cephalotrichum gorgonifer]